MTSVAINASSNVGTTTTSKMKSSSALRLRCTRRRSASSSLADISSTISTSKYGRASWAWRSLSVSICEGSSWSLSRVLASWR